MYVSERAISSQSALRHTGHGVVCKWFIRGIPSDEHASGACPCYPFHERWGGSAVCPVWLTRTKQTAANKGCHVRLGPLCHFARWACAQQAPS